MILCIFGENFEFMTIADKKLKIIELVAKTDDVGVLDSVEGLLEDDFSHDHWENLSSEQKARIKQSMDSIQAGNFRTTKEVMTDLRKKQLEENEKTS